MNDLNWKTWSLIFLLAMGITFEVIKRLPSSSSKWTADNLKLASAHTTPYQVKYNRTNKAPNVLAMKPQIQAQHTAGMAAINRETIQKFIAANSTHTSDFKHDEKAAPGKEAKAKKKKGDEEWEIVVDPKTGKRYRRKKKKVVQLEEPKAEVAAKEEPKKEEPRKEEDFDALMNDAIASGGLPPVGDGQPDNPNADFQEWKNRLLSHPDPVETRRFIEHKKNGLVSDEIFYKIVYLMLEDVRPRMKELGVLCAGMTPSVLSFQVLNEVLGEERSGSSLRKYSESFLAQYSTPGNLNILERVMKAPSSNALALQATKRLDNAANIYLAPAKNKPPKGASASSANGHSNASYFRRFTVVLQALIRNPDPELKEQARLTLANLTHLMNVSPAPTTVAPSPATPAQASAQ